MRSQQEILDTDEVTYAREDLNALILDQIKTEHDREECNKQVQYYLDEFLDIMGYHVDRAISNARKEGHYVNIENMVSDIIMGWPNEPVEMRQKDIEGSVIEFYFYNHESIYPFKVKDSSCQWMREEFTAHVLLKDNHPFAESVAVVADLVMRYQSTADYKAAVKLAYNLVHSVNGRERYPA